MKIERFVLERVHYMPKELAPGILYVSEAFGTAAHLCACGCSKKIRTPLGPCEWRIDETPTGPSLRPSIGNWQQACQSHYWILEGAVRWAAKWTPEQIAAGREAEAAHRRAYYDDLYQQHGWFRRFWRWVKSLWG